MKKFFIFFVFICSCMGFATDESANASAPGAYDADLFRKDVKVCFTDIEFLYWTAEVADLDYALTMQNPAPDDRMLYALGHYDRAKYNWDPGFRVTIGYFNAPHYWQVYGTYTWQRIKGTNHSVKPTQDDLYLIPTWSAIFNLIVPEPVLTADSYVRLNYNLADLVFDRVYITNPHLRLKLLGALTGALIEQKFNVDYLTEHFVSRVHTMWRFMGIGFRLGVSLDWYLNFADLYLTAKATTATFIGSYKNLSYQTNDCGVLDDEDGEEAIEETVRDGLYKDWRPSFETQFMVGPSYQKAFKSCRFELFAGYEMTNWFNLNEIYRSSTSFYPQTSKETYINNSMIALHGLTLRTTFDF